MTGQPSGWWGQILFRGRPPASPTGAGATYSFLTSLFNLTRRTGQQTTAVVSTHQ